MQRLMRRHDRLNGDRGAVGILIAIIMTFGILGLGAVAIDVGSWHAEKAQLQNGADAAAVAVAQMCATTPSSCTNAAALPVAQDRANNNSNDALSNVDFVCGTGLGGCPASLCPAGANNYVNVQTSTKTSTSNSLPSIMGKALPGDSGAGETIHACAQASWGFPTGATTISMTISNCEWYQDTNGGATFAAPPPYLVAPTTTTWPPRFPFNSYDGKASPPQLPTVGGEDVLALHGTGNTVTNGDFDTTPFGWTGTPNGANKGPNLAQDLTTVHDGTGSMKITWKAGAAGAQSADDPNQPTISGQAYSLTGWVYVPSGQPAVKLYVNNGGVLSYSSVQTADSQWHQLAVESTAAGTNVTIGLVSAAATTLNQVAYLDTVVLALKTGAQCQGAPSPPSGFDQPGGFGWLSDPSSDCSTVVSANNTIFDNTGASVDASCTSVLQDASCEPGPEPTPPCQPKILFIPIYDGFCSVNSKTCDVNVICPGKPAQSTGCYHIKGFAAFVPTGFQLSGSGGLTQKSSISNTSYCRGNDKCMYGFFTHELLPYQGSTGPGGTFFGVAIVTLTG